MSRFCRDVDIMLLLGFGLTAAVAKCVGAGTMTVGWWVGAGGVGGGITYKTHTHTHTHS